MRGQADLPPPAVLRQLGWSLDLPVEGRSMEPLFKVGDTVTILCEPLSGIKPGDIICFRRDSGFFLHRLIEQRADGAWLEKGDADCGGSWICSDSVLGRATLLNGRPITERVRDRALGFSRVELSMARWRRRIGLSRLPVRWAELWRRAKLRWLRRGSEEEHGSL